ncbi:MAG: hypothetical protein L6R38_006651 [Xanthoria sp. 2 TBL-2021]|nr:MAG: hypothetical protein L6R38_006651 [Xanthoria sp. 2 TBL-2021]
MLLRWSVPLLVSCPSLVQAFPAINPRAPPVLENTQEEADVCTEYSICGEKGHDYWDILHTTLSNPQSADRADTTGHFNKYYAPELAGYFEVGVEDPEMALKMRERGMDTADMDIWEVNSFDPVRKIRLKQTAYFNAFNTAAGIIIAKGNWRSSDQNKKEDQLQWSEIMFQTWKKAAAQAERDQLPHGPISNLRAVVQSNVVNHGTTEIFRAAYKENKLEPWEDPHWRSWTEDSHRSFFFAMLGTDNVKGTIWLLNDHAAGIGRKEISAIHTMWDDHLDIWYVHETHRIYYSQFMHLDISGSWLQAAGIAAVQIQAAEPLLTCGQSQDRYSTLSMD